jgi:hypothetical protein
MLLLSNESYGKQNGDGNEYRRIPKAVASALFGNDDGFFTSLSQK